MNAIAILAALFFSQSLWADIPGHRQPTLAPGYGPLLFEAPKAGSYSLPPIGPAADGSVVTTEEQKIRLHDLMGDRIVLLSFIYSTCTDANGCPLATFVFHRINRLLQKDPELASKLRLLTLSFNPAHDTPETLRRYAKSFTGNGVDWRFLTTESEKALQPILDGYRQDIQKIIDQEGQFTGTFSHILRVYLIDQHKQLRNIYSVSFLHPESLINDFKTLVDEEPLEPHSEPNIRQGDSSGSSVSLNWRTGQPADLLGNLTHPPLGLPPVPVPQDNPATTEKISLGRKLFYDRRLSLNNTFSCAMCHIPEQGFSSNEMATAIGIEGRSVRRNSPTLYNVAYAPLLFHDGRETTLENQVWGPLLASNEMGNPSIGYLINKIRSFSDYQGLFEKAFRKGPTIETIGQAIASYERSLISAGSRFDQWHFGGQKNALAEPARRGFRLFVGKAGCNACHQISAEYALFSDDQLHNTGIGYAESMRKMPTTRNIELAPGIHVEVDSDTINRVSEPQANDLGHYEISQQPGDRWKYKTPTLRNISLTAPYMHNGSLATLKQVVRFYNQGGIENENLDPRIKPLGLNEREIVDLVEFLRSLTGANIDELLDDAFAAPVGDIR